MSFLSIYKARTIESMLFLKGDLGVLIVKNGNMLMDNYSHFILEVGNLITEYAYITKIIYLMSRS